VIRHTQTHTHSLYFSFSVGPLWKGEGRGAGSLTCAKNTVFTQERHPCSGGIRNRKPNKWGAADLFCFVFFPYVLYIRLLLGTGERGCRSEGLMFTSQRRL